MWDVCEDASTEVVKIFSMINLSAFLRSSFTHVYLKKLQTFGNNTTKDKPWNVCLSLTVTINHMHRY